MTPETLTVNQVAFLLKISPRSSLDVLKSEVSKNNRR